MENGYLFKVNYSEIVSYDGSEEDDQEGGDNCTTIALDAESAIKRVRENCVGKTREYTYDEKDHKGIVKDIIVHSVVRHGWMDLV
jgi:hypothetical protein